MKKYFFGLTAILFAVVAVSFTTKNNASREDVFFSYTAPSGSYTQANVENPANYVEVSDLTTGCDNQSELACRIKVTNLSVIQGTAPSRTLISSGVNKALIIAGQFATNKYFVTSAGDVATARNKSE
jgi:hypothetical protein